jgi:hypothetical protein
VIKIVLASYFQPENHGSGRKIGITHDKPPKLEDEVDYVCDKCYQGLSPDRQSMITYYVERNKIKREANNSWNFNEEQRNRMAKIGNQFQKEYREKLQAFVDHVLEQSKSMGKSVEKIVGLKDGDTLLSLERKGSQSFRSITAEYLRKLGYYVSEE